MNNILLGKRIREERLKLNLTQEKLAESIDISDSYMGQVERGEKNITLVTLVKLANRLGVTIDYLLKDSFDIANSTFLNQIKQLVSKRSDKEKDMIIDLIKILLSHLDDMK